MNPDTIRRDDKCLNLVKHALTKNFRIELMTPTPSPNEVLVHEVWGRILPWFENLKDPGPCFHVEVALGDRRPRRLRPRSSKLLPEQSCSPL